jgi:hypothetical protein
MVKAETEVGRVEVAVTIDWEKEVNVADGWVKVDTGTCVVKLVMIRSLFVVKGVVVV